MSREWVQKTLMNLGFSEKDSRVYVFIAAEGPKKARDIAEALNINASQLYRILKKLHIRGLVNASSDYPAVFSAVIFEKILELLIDAKKEQHKALVASKKELLFTWKSLTEKDEEKS